MISVHDKKVLNSIFFFGRTISDKQSGAVFFNWSGSGFEINFEGKRLDVCLQAIETVFPPEGILWPWISVYVDDSEAPVKDIEIDKHEQLVTLFSSAVSEKHKIKLVKRIENDKGKIGVAGFEFDGELLPSEPRKSRYLLEFIGDSITCGFGNEAKQRDDLFITKEENGNLAYSAIAAKLLGADYSSICVSGIPLCKPLDPQFKLPVPGFPDLDFKPRAMEDSYEYTDRLYEEVCGRDSDFTAWDFSRFIPDAIIINLGTNDSYRIKASKDKAAEERHFESRYKDFIYKVRNLNGPDPVICCTLGSMDYYLFDNILRAAEGYKRETGDEKIFCFKFGGIFPFDEGYGAQAHPSVKTHYRMGKELSGMLQEWLKLRYVQ